MAKKKTFEASVEELEALIERIEAGEIGLEEALKHYEKGTQLIANCRGILDSAQKKIAELTGEQDSGAGAGAGSGAGLGSGDG